MTFKRQRTHALMKEQLVNEATGPVKKLGGSWFAKKIDGDVKIYLQTDNDKFDEITKACFELTMQRSSAFPTTEIKQNLKQFMEAN